MACATNRESLETATRLGCESELRIIQANRKQTERNAQTIPNSQHTAHNQKRESNANKAHAAQSGGGDAYERVE